MSNQADAAIGAQAFGTIGPAGIVAVRQLVAAVVFLRVARLRLHRLTWAMPWPTLSLATMNLAVYIAIHRIGLALAVTHEFIGPLGVAMPSSRSRHHALTAVGVYVLVLPGPSSDGSERRRLLSGLHPAHLDAGPAALGPAGTGAPRGFRGSS